MFDLLKNQILKQRFPAGSSRGFTSWDSVRTICLAGTIDSDFNRKALDNFRKQSGKEVDFVLFHNDKLSKSDCFLSLNKKDFNLLGLPNEEAGKKLRSKEYDVLIDINQKNSSAGKALSLVLKAKCKVGHNSLAYANLFDISMDLKENTNLENYLKQVLNYLMMIRTK